MKRVKGKKTSSMRSRNDFYLLQLFAVHRAYVPLEVVLPAFKRAHSKVTLAGLAGDVGFFSIVGMLDPQVAMKVSLRRVALITHYANERPSVFILMFASDPMSARSVGGCLMKR